MVQHEGAVGVKFYTGYDCFNPQDVIPQMEHLAELNIPMIFHMGDTLRSVKSARLRYAQPLIIDDIASDYPEITFVIAHMGYPWHKDTAAAVYYKNDNVYTDISGFVYGEFTSFTGSHDKLLFGTDFPISDQSSYISSINEIVDARVLTNNVKKVFKL
jgi:hypothetical protein